MLPKVHSCSLSSECRKQKKEVRHCINDGNRVLSNFYGSLVDLRCCVGFCYTANGISYTYTQTHPFLDYFPIKTITEYWVDFPMLYGRSSQNFCFNRIWSLSMKFSTRTGSLSMCIRKYTPWRGLKHFPPTRHLKQPLHKRNDQVYSTFKKGQSSLSRREENKVLNIVRIKKLTVTEEAIDGRSSQQPRKKTDPHHWVAHKAQTSCTPRPGMGWETRCPRHSQPPPPTFVFGNNPITTFPVSVSTYIT